MRGLYRVGARSAHVSAVLLPLRLVAAGVDGTRVGAFRAGAGFGADGVGVAGAGGGAAGGLGGLVAAAELFSGVLAADVLGVAGNLASALTGGVVVVAAGKRGE